MRSSPPDATVASRSAGCGSFHGAGGDGARRQRRGWRGRHGLLLLLLHVGCGGHDGRQELGTGERMARRHGTRASGDCVVVRVVMDWRQVSRMVGHDEGVAHVTRHHQSGAHLDSMSLHVSLFQSLFFCSPILEPNLDLGLGEAEVGGEFGSFRDRKVLLCLEFLFQSHQLLRRKRRPGFTIAFMLP